jgi:hypothetical protein
MKLFIGGFMKTTKNYYIPFFLALIIGLFLCLPAIVGAQAKISDKPMKYWSQEEWKQWAERQHKLQLLKGTGAADRREGVMVGNKIRTVFYNYGSIGRPNTEPSIEWPRESTHGYAYEFGPMIGAEVVDAFGDTVRIFSEALIDGGDSAPGGKVWGWQPLPQYLNTSAKPPTPAMSNKPDTWPKTQDVSNPFYNPDATGDNDRFLWPGVDTLGQISGDLEAFWVMDDRDNDEFDYYPFINDSSRRGLGMELTCRLLQFSAAPAEDVIFYIIEIKNVSDKRLEKVVAAMFGDPHIGGPGDFADDYAGFNREANMVYSWDKEGSGNDYSIPWSELGWLGFKFLESPLDDQGNELGLTSMTAPRYASTEGAPATDDIMWEKLQPGLFDEANIAQEADNVFLFGTGYFSLDPGETQQFSIAVLMGKGLQDLEANAEVAQDIYNRNYKFTKAPDPPKVSAIAGDREVTLYWDTKSEDSFDDFFQVKDFEGYKIYKSTDKGQTWGPVITNSFGLDVAFKPIAQFDNENNVEGLFPFDKDGYRFDLGKNTGLVHSFTDTDVINGVTYYYSVTAYDSGYVSEGIHPVESGRFDGQNLVAVMPSPRVPGYETAQSLVNHTAGLSTASIDVKVLDPTLVTGDLYEISFEDSSTGKIVANIFNTETGDTVVSQQDELSGFPFIFDGLITSITDEPVVTIIDSLSGWTEESKSTLQTTISLFPQKGFRLPRDLEIRFYDTYKDTSVLVNPIPVRFEIWNVNDNEKLDILLFSSNKDTIDAEDRIVAIIYQNNIPTGTWEVKFSDPNSGAIIGPSAGDVIKITIAKPFELIDKYEIETQQTTVADVNTKIDFMANIAVVPNPYVVSSSYETPPPSVFSVGRGERRVLFMNIPPKCTIRIYTINGELLRTIEHNGPLENGMEPWDLLTDEGLDISYGVYVYHVDAGQYGKKIGKFAIIK